MSDIIQRVHVPHYVRRCEAFKVWGGNRGTRSWATLCGEWIVREDGSRCYVLTAWGNRIMAHIDGDWYEQTTRSLGPAFMRARRMCEVGVTIEVSAATLDDLIEYGLVGCVSQRISRAVS